MPLAVAAVAAVIAVVWLVRRRSQDVRCLSVWQRVLADNHGLRQAQRLAGQVRHRYTDLLVERPLSENVILRRHATTNILPGLTLSQVLLEEHGNDRQIALTEIDEAFRASTLVKNRMRLASLKVVPNPFGLIRMAFNRGMKAFPAEGWDFECVENSTSRIAFDATRCFYLDTLTAYGAPEQPRSARPTRYGPDYSLPR